ncbi:AlbA family DNA-binding domain-containing protein [Aeromicrobium massiliense]|uniref:AlbA family DNA-binding domain-containing protein n=1 Tax=Aeromicrobium massiliense TaxID=1464554 RepID=UPI0006766C5B|nr:RNA-binding domain-containing protein [Aeromicrobium massiliense]
MLTVDEIEELLRLGHETRPFEVKGPGNLGSKPFCAKVARAAMALGNLTDGGTLVLGVNDQDLPSMAPGLSSDQAEQWSKFDDVADAIARYSDPPVKFGLRIEQLSNGNTICVLDIEEFELSPHICKRDLPGELVAGQLYVRPRGKPRSTNVPDSAEMREVLDLATAKALRRYISTLSDAGLLTSTRPVEVSDESRFDDERDRAWRLGESPLRADGPTTSYFDAAVRPGPYENRRIPPAELMNFMTSHTVRLRGWPVPFIEQATPLRAASCLGQDESTRSESWRLCSSGQFLHRRMFASDMHDVPSLKPRRSQASAVIAVWDVLLYFVELAELGSRFAVATGCSTVDFTVTLRGVDGRELVAGDWRRELVSNPVFHGHEIEARVTAEAPALIASPTQFAIDLTQQVLENFGVSIPESALDDWQAEILRRR